MVPIDLVRIDLARDTK